MRRWGERAEGATTHSDSERPRSREHAYSHLSNRALLRVLAQRRTSRMNAAEQVARTSGRPLDPATRAEMEHRLAGIRPRSAGSHAEHEADQLSAAALDRAPGGDRVDLGAVRIHTGGAAEPAAETMVARAYSLGDHIVFGAGQLDLSSPSGRALLAHELVHVLQARANGAQVVRCKNYKTPQLLDPMNNDSDRVVVKDDTELAKARSLYEKFKRDYNIVLDSTGARASYENRPAWMAPDPDRPPFPTEIVPWTLEELRELDRALSNFAPLLTPTARGMGRSGPKRIGRLRFDVPKSSDPFLQAVEPDLAGQHVGGDVVLFDAMKRNPFGPVGTMVHELGHSMFSTLKSEFLKLRYWKDEKTHMTQEEIDREPDDILGLHRSFYEQPMRAYGTKSVDEDVADSVMFYFLDQRPLTDFDSFRARCPLRYNIISKWFWQQKNAVKPP